MKRRDFVVLGVGASAVAAGALAPARAEEPAEEEKRSQVYKCDECGAVVEILVPGTATLVHCGKPMKLQPEQTTGPLAPKHVPVIEKVEGGYKVKVGATPHPMLQAHHIVWIELVADGAAYRKFLVIGGPPEAVFPVEAKTVSARAYCNLHGLWKSV